MPASRLIGTQDTLTNSLLIVAVLVLVVGVGFHPRAHASGGVGLPPAGSTPGGTSRKIDRVYEYGKSIYLGRAPGTEKIKYCVLKDGEPKKIKGRHLKPYRGKDKLTFANALLDCAEPSKKALLTMERDHIPYVLYYLNKRFKLQLADT